jgi:hypothetical protein
VVVQFLLFPRDTCKRRIWAAAVDLGGGQFKPLASAATTSSVVVCVFFLSSLSFDGGVRGTL